MLHVLSKPVFANWTKINSSSQWLKIYEKYKISEPYDYWWEAGFHTDVIKMYRGFFELQAEQQTENKPNNLAVTRK